MSLSINSSTAGQMDQSVNMKSQDTDYSWLRDANWPNSVSDKIINHLNQENQRYNDFFHTRNDQVEAMFNELKGRIKEDDWTPGIIIGSYEYYSYIKAGQDYWIHARKLLVDGTAEEILLDENLDAKSQKFYEVGCVKISPNHKLLAYTVDLNGSEQYDVFVKDVASGKIIDRNVKATFGHVEWNHNSDAIYYIPTGKDWRAKKVYCHSIYADQASSDALIYEELDKTFWVSIEKSSSQEYLVINSEAADSNELRVLNLLTNELKLILPRKADLLYSLTHHQNNFYLTINDQGKDNRIIKTSVLNPSSNWHEIIAHTKGTYICETIAYKNHLVIEKRVLGLVQISILNLSTSHINEVNFSDESYDAHVIFTTFDAIALRYKYSSLACPNMTSEYNFDAGHNPLPLKLQEVPSGFNNEHYVTKRIWAESSDGALVPVTVMYKKDLVKFDGSNPAYLYGYGSYGHAVTPSFKTNILSLVDRGFVFAIAHIRGGDDLGYEWYESAKMLTKKRTFEDFIASAQALIELGYTSEGDIATCGGSAGGMLVGACVNSAPQLFKTAILHVPFVDVLATMLDESLPLTQIEFKEWGNPKQPEFYGYIKSYSPFDNITKQNYPHILITSGLNDPRVTYWEPAKYAQKLRDYKTDNNLLLLKTNMEGGHQGKSGRYDYLKEVAEEYVFMLSLYQIAIKK